MSQILEGTLKQYESKLYNIEKKLCKTIKHKELLLSYKKSKKYHKGMKLKFNISLCNRNIQLKSGWNKILDTASFRIRDKTTKALKKEITSLKRKRCENHTSIKNNTTKENDKLIKKTVAQKVVILEHKIKSRQSRKKERDHIQHATAPQKRNRRFKRNIAIDKRKEKRKRYKARKKNDIKEIIENAPDQNAINLSNAVLSEDQKTLLKKGPSFIPTPTNINWYDVRKDFTKFINKIRHFADVSDQPVQQQKQQQQLESNPENIVSTSINALPPGKSPPVSSIVNKSTNQSKAITAA